MPDTLNEDKPLVEDTIRLEQIEWITTLECAVTALMERAEMLLQPDGEEVHQTAVQLAHQSIDAAINIRDAIHSLGLRSSGDHVPGDGPPFRDFDFPADVAVFFKHLRIRSFRDLKHIPRDELVEIFDSPHMSYPPTTREVVLELWDSTTLTYAGKDFLYE
jgi:hypothetical protein